MTQIPQQSKILLVVVGVLTTALVSFFGWLALAIVDIRVNVAEMKRDIASLLASRQTAETEQRQSTGQRLNDLENDGRRKSR